MMLWILLIASFVLSFKGHTERLPEKQCDTFKHKRKALISQGVRNKMEKGPQWAKDNLKPEELEYIKDYIHLTEILLFQCNGKPEASLKTLASKTKQKKKLAAYPLPDRKPIAKIAENKLRAVDLIPTAEAKAAPDLKLGKQGIKPPDKEKEEKDTLRQSISPAQNENSASPNTPSSQDEKFVQPIRPIPAQQKTDQALQFILEAN
ncbi:MAG: hypothetical protein AAF228_09975 [Pseudomonadota bacterium]